MKKLHRTWHRLSKGPFPDEEKVSKANTWENTLLLISFTVHCRYVNNVTTSTLHVTILFYFRDNQLRRWVTRSHRVVTQKRKKFPSHLPWRPSNYFPMRAKKEWVLQSHFALKNCKLMHCYSPFVASWRERTAFHYCPVGDGTRGNRSRENGTSPLFSFLRKCHSHIDCFYVGWAFRTGRHPCISHPEPIRVGAWWCGAWRCSRNSGRICWGIWRPVVDGRAEESLRPPRIGRNGAWLRAWLGRNCRGVPGFNAKWRSSHARRPPWRKGQNYFWKSRGYLRVAPRVRFPFFWK